MTNNNDGRMKLTCLGRYGPYPAAGGASSGYLLQAGGKKLLLECGSGVFSRLLQHCAFYELDAILLSHLHVDHTTDMRIMSQALHLHDDKMLDVYLPASPEAEYEDIARRNFLPQTITDGRQVQLGDIAVSFHKAAHPVECYSMRIEYGGRVLFFTGDTNWHNALVGNAQDADLLICDCALLESIWKPGKPHLSPRLAGRLGREAGAARLLLTHIIPRIKTKKYLEQARSEYPDAELIEEGEEYTV